MSNGIDKETSTTFDPFFDTLSYIYDTPENETNGLPDGYRIGIAPVIYEGRFPPFKPASYSPWAKPDGTYEFTWCTPQDFLDNNTANYVLIIKIGPAPNHELLHQWHPEDGWPGEADFSKQQQQDKQGG